MDGKKVASEQHEERRQNKGDAWEIDAPVQGQACRTSAFQVVITMPNSSRALAMPPLPSTHSLPVTRTFNNLIPPIRHRSTEGRKEVQRLHKQSVRTYELAKLHVEPDTVCFINSSLRSQESRVKKQESKNQRTQEPRSSARGFGGRKGGIRQAASGCYIRKKARDVDAVAVHASLVLL